MPRMTILFFLWMSIGKIFSSVSRQHCRFYVFPSIKKIFEFFFFMHAYHWNFLQPTVVKFLFWIVESRLEYFTYERYKNIAGREKSVKNTVEAGKKKAEAKSTFISSKKLLERSKKSIHPSIQPRYVGEMQRERGIFFHIRLISSVASRLSNRREWIAAAGGRKNEYLRNNASGPFFFFSSSPPPPPKVELSIRGRNFVTRKRI